LYFIAVKVLVHFCTFYKQIYHRYCFVIKQHSDSTES